jgi:4,5-DOPA dioxygenase extradiol
MNKKNLMPILFCAHGSPMNAIAHNHFTESLSKIPSTFPRPKAILMISAHWTTRGTFITAMPNPKTIHDFYGFPKELFDVNYLAPGDPDLAQSLIKEISSTEIIADTKEWGLDHGTWSVLKHIFPNADIPVVQLSLDMTKPNEFHFELGQKLKYLRAQGILIMGSGNIVHNLRKIDWDENAKPFDWATEFDEWVKEKAIKREFHALTSDFLKSPSGQLSNPSLEHYLPLLYILGAVDENDQLSFPFEGMQHGSLSMRTFMWS